MIKNITLDQVLLYKTKAEKDDILFSNLARYVGYFQDEEMLGFGSLLMYNKTAKIKTLWVRPEYRGRGIFKKIVAHLIDLAGDRIIEANCTKMSINHFIAIGFKPVQTYKNGVVRVTNENI
jgi:ribosomal protein S18 acetylase RimI-like enzyme